MNKEDRLNSWKEISDYIKRDISTCIKWENKYGFPVYRIDVNSPKSSVFAYKTEIDNWFNKRKNQK